MSGQTRHPPPALTQAAPPPAPPPSPVAGALGRLDAWFQSLRRPRGFGGPVVHWWDTSLLFAGPMTDWRYEGVICGYVELFERFGDGRWLERACAAADDVVDTQLPGGTFRASSFEVGVSTGGTPHEAAVDVGLLCLARCLRQRGDARWARYFAAAERNVREYLIARLWNGDGFREQPWDETLVANKNATTLEAMLLYEALSGADVEPFLRAAAAVVLSLQERAGPRRGATVHAGTGRSRLTIGIYTARCASALVRLYDRLPDRMYLDAAGAALRYLNGLRRAGGTAFGHSRSGTPIEAPRWISPSGDLMRAALLGEAHGLTPDGMVDHLERVLVEAQYASGGLPTALGLAQRGAKSLRPHLPDFRDALPVAGWCDKAFRALALRVDTAPVPLPVQPSVTDCSWRGRRCRLREDEEVLLLEDALTGLAQYRWRKGSTYPDLLV